MEMDQKIITINSQSEQTRLIVYYHATIIGRLTLLLDFLILLSLSEGER
jgi:hypothetical protein